MCKQLVLMVFAAIFSLTAVNAQDSTGRQRQTAEERTKSTMEMFEVLNLDAAAKTKTEAVIAEFNNAQQKAMEDMRAGGTVDREAMMAKRQELADARDAKLKEILTEEQMKKWKDEIEPALRSQRANNQRGNK